MFVSAGTNERYSTTNILKNPKSKSFCRTGKKVLDFGFFNIFVVLYLSLVPAETNMLFVYLSLEVLLGDHI